MKKPFYLTAREIAIKAHAGQKRWDGGDYYTNHVAKVSEFLQRNLRSILPESALNNWYYNLDNFDCILSAAELHDVIEDTNVTLDDLRQAGMPPLVLDIVDVLTKRKGESYFNFIMRIHDCGSITVATRAIKIADIICNMEDADEKEKKSARYAKYELSKYILSGGKW